MKKRLISMLLVLVLCAGMSGIPAYETKAAENNSTPTVDVYLSVSHDASYYETPEGHVMAFQKMTVPYFDLKLYGLERFYFVSETYEKGEDTEENASGQIEKPSSNLQPGTAESAEGKITMLHALIYATEVYYLGFDPEDAGKGGGKYVVDTEKFMPIGSVGSMYLKQFWGMDENLNYYLNYQYPLASPGWGSTADQILLHDGDHITIGHFSNWSFHNDSLSVFNLIKARNEIITTEAVQNSKIDLTVYLAGAGGNYTTAHTPRTEKPAVYYIPVEELDDGVVSRWNYLGNADENGDITIDVSMNPGEYLVCIAGQYGKELPNAIVSTPGGIILKVTEPEEESLLGDVNGDGTIDGRDVVRLRKYTAGMEDITIVEANSEVTGDGTVDGRDVVRLRKFTAGMEGIVLGK